MFFSKLARILAIAALVLGISEILIGLAAVAGSWTPDEIARYGGKSLGLAIDRGIYMMLSAAALGTVAEISLSKRKPQPHERAAESR